MSDIAQWLGSIGLQQYAEIFAANHIELEIVPELDHDTLKEIGISSAGHRLKLLKAAQRLDTASASSSTPADSTLESALNFGADAERRPLTVMFCDMVGSTAMSVHMDAEDLQDVISYYRDTCTSVIERHGGYVARFYGDGMLVYFGYPLASEHDPENAARAALTIIETLETPPTPQLKLQVRIGIANGDVVVGALIGRGESLERAVTGETPNLAARLQEHAEPNTVAVSSRVRRLIGDLFECADLGRVEFKGFDRPVHIWRVISDQPIDSRFEFICAEPGFGKSRLLQAVRAKVSEAPHTVVRFNCMPLNQNSAMRPLIESVISAAAIEAADDIDNKLDKLDTLLSDHLGVEEIGLLASMLSLPAEHRYSVPDITPQARKERTLSALGSYLCSLAKDTPVIIFFEDLHWIDPSTLEFLSLLPARIATTRILLIGTYRPEFELPWPVANNISTLHLGRLTSDQAANLLAVISNDRLSNSVTQEIIVKADGIPLYLEELSLSAMETIANSGHDPDIVGQESQQLTQPVIPDTLQASLIGRLDRLGSAKALIQVCAVIGRHFTIELVAQVTSLTCKVLTTEFERLTTADLVFPLQGDSALPAGTYSFKHALVQETAYSTLLRARRRELHRKIATVLMSNVTMVQTQPERIAQHLSAAESHDESIEHWRNAGLIAMGKSSNDEAISHFDNALAAVATIEDQQTRYGEELALTVLSTVPKMLTQGWAAPDVKVGYERARELSDLVGDAASKELFSARCGLAAYYIVIANWQEAKRIATQNLALAGNYDLSEILTEASVGRATVQFYSERASQALPLLEQTINSFDPQCTPIHLLQYGRHPLVLAYVTRALAQWTLGRSDLAVADVDNAIGVVQETPHPFSRAWALAGAVIIDILRGNFNRAESVSDELIDYAQDQRFPYWLGQALIFRGWASLEKNVDAEAALAKIEQGLEIWYASGTRMLTPLMNTPRITALVKLQRLEEAHKAVQSLFDFVEQSGENWWLPEIHRLKAHCLEHEKGIGHVDVLKAAMAAYKAAIVQQSAGMALRAGNDVARHCLYNNKPDKVITFLADLTNQLQRYDPNGSEVLTAQQHLTSARKLAGTGGRKNNRGV